MGETDEFSPFQTSGARRWQQFLFHFTYRLNQFLCLSELNFLCARVILEHFPRETLALLALRNLGWVELNLDITYTYEVPVFMKLQRLVSPWVQGLETQSHARRAGLEGRVGQGPRVCGGSVSEVALEGAFCSHYLRASRILWDP